jgi:hypothetical protein
MANFILQKTHNTEIFSQDAAVFSFAGFFDASRFANSRPARRLS